MRFLSVVALFLSLSPAPPAKVVVVIRGGKPTPAFADVANRKTDLLYFQNADSIPYKIVWTDKFHGSPFLAPAAPSDKSSITVQPFASPAGPFKVHDLAKPGQKYTYDIMSVRDGKTSRAGNGTVVVE